MSLFIYLSWLSLSLSPSLFYLCPSLSLSAVLGAAVNDYTVTFVRACKLWFVCISGQNVTVVRLEFSGCKQAHLSFCLLGNINSVFEFLCKSSFQSVQNALMLSFYAPYYFEMVIVQCLLAERYCRVCACVCVCVCVCVSVSVMSRPSS